MILENSVFCFHAGIGSARNLTVFPVGLVLKEGYERKRECEKFKDYAKRLIKAQQLERYYVGEAFSRALHM